MKNRGGSETADSTTVIESNIESSNQKWSMRKNVWRNVLGVWGVVQVVSILANAIKRLYPIAIQPFLQKDMLTYHWVMYVAWSLYMGYAEGYKAFQLKFSPMVVARAFNIAEKPTILNCILAGPYSMGLFGASRKRMIVGWCITAGVFSLVKVVKMLPYPYRSIVDAGVVVGLSYGTMSIVAFAVKALMGGEVVAPGEEGEEEVQVQEQAASSDKTKQQ